MSIEQECTEFKRTRDYEYRSFFEYVAKIYDLGLKVLTLGHEYTIRGKLIKTAVNLTPKSNQKKLVVLDLCTGTGSLALLFKEMYPSSVVYGIDVSEGMLNVAKEKARRKALSVIFKKCDVQHLPFHDESFDIVMSSLCTHELPLQIRNKVLREISRILKKDGVLAVLDYGYPQSSFQKAIYNLLMGVEEESAKEYLSKPFARDLIQNGFKVVKRLSTLYGYLEYYFAKKKV